jgi:hypothetical protein
MDRKLILLVAISAFTATSAQAIEWVAYDGATPDNAVSLNEGTEDAIICRKNERVGLLTDGGKCYSVKIGGDISKKTMDDGFELLVDNSGTNMAAQWIAYDGTTPDNAVSLNEGTEDAIICRKNARVGLLTDGGKCYSVKIGGDISKKTMDDGFELLMDVPPNTNPILASIGDKEVTEGSELSFELSASDADGDELAYLVSGNPAGSELSGSVFSWTPDSSDPESYTMTISVSDGHGGSASETITITVTAPALTEGYCGAILSVDPTVLNGIDQWIYVHSLGTDIYGTAICGRIDNPKYNFNCKEAGKNPEVKKMLALKWISAPSGDEFTQACDDAISIATSCADKIKITTFGQSGTKQHTYTKPPVYVSSFSVSDLSEIDIDHIDQLSADAGKNGIVQVYPYGIKADRWIMGMNNSKNPQCE